MEILLAQQIKFQCQSMTVYVLRVKIFLLPVLYCIFTPHSYMWYRLASSLAYIL
jgi:hypothetical protein